MRNADYYNANIIIDYIENLILTSSRQASSLYPVWKRAAIYKTIREIVTTDMVDDIKELYHFTIDGVQEGWICTCWYDGPRSWRNLRNTKTLNWHDDENMLSYLEVIDIRYEEFEKFVDFAVESRNDTIEYMSVDDLLEKHGYTKRLLCSRDRSNYFSVTDEFKFDNPHWFV